jgi:hypothetical protein
MSKESISEVDASADDSGKEENVYCLHHDISKAVQLIISNNAVFLTYD